MCSVAGVYSTEEPIVKIQRNAFWLDRSNRHRIFQWVTTNCRVFRWRANPHIEFYSNSIAPRHCSFESPEGPFRVHKNDFAGIEIIRRSW